MSYYPDLTPYEYTQANSSGNILNIGWLDVAYPYPEGVVSSETLADILKLCESPVNRMRGFQVCSFCDAAPFGLAVETAAGKTLLLGSAEIWVAGPNNLTYAAPDLIYHFIKDHHYLPPDEFLQSLESNTFREHPT